MTINPYCLMCYLQVGDSIMSENDTYKVMKGFKFQKITKIVKLEIPNDTTDYYRKIYEKNNKDAGKVKKQPSKDMPKITQEIIIGSSIIGKKINFDGKEYNFNNDNIWKTATNLSLKIAEKYMKDKKYRDFVLWNLEQKNNYDNSGNKIVIPDFIGKWKVIKYLDSGKFGVTYIVKQSGDEYVMKTFKKGKSKAIVQKECNFAKIAGDNGIGPKILECNKELNYILMEKLNGGNLLSYINNNNGKISKDIVDQIFKLLDGLDNLNILHKDVHLGNFLFDSKGRLYIIDYGMSVKGRGNKGWFRRLVVEKIYNKYPKLAEKLEKKC